jgi:lactate dehydrogenase-like 2-hydroxyacid dehydrogenase
MTHEQTGSQAASATTTPVVLLPGPMNDTVMHGCEARFDVLRAWEADDPEALIDDRAKDVVGIATVGHRRVDADLMGRLPNLQIVANFGVGYDTVDAAEAARRGVVVTNTPGVLDDEVADTALGLLLMTVRELPQSERYLRAGRWAEEGPYPLTPATLRGRSLGVLGLGRVGETIAARAEAFGLTIGYHNRRPKPESPYRYFPTLLEMAREVDTLLVATPGGDETKHLVDAEVLSALGDQGVVINVARGSVVDEPALAAALGSGTILAAGLDVYEDEPRVHPELLTMDRVVLLPHVGSASIATRQAMGQLVVDNLVSWFDRGRAVTPVSESEPLL